MKINYNVEVKTSINGKPSFLYYQWPTLCM